MLYLCPNFYSFIYAFQQFISNWHNRFLIKTVIANNHERSSVMLIFVDDLTFLFVYFSISNLLIPITKTYFRADLVVIGLICFYQKRICQFLNLKYHAQIKFIYFCIQVRRKNLMFSNWFFICWLFLIYLIKFLIWSNNLSILFLSS